MYWIAFGDVHEHTATISRIPDMEGAEGVIVTGDLTNRGDAATAERILDAIRVRNPRVLAQIGNMDTRAVHRVLEDQSVNLHLRVLHLTPGSKDVKIGIFGVGFSTPTPFGTPSEVEESTISQWLDQIRPQLAQFDHVVAVIHTPPLDTATDRLGSGAHIGSPAVRAFLEEVQPAVCITGHIHESGGVDRIGETVVVNPGMLAQGGYVRLEIKDGKPVAKLMKVGA